jgi:hypothetical protein
VGVQGVWLRVVFMPGRIGNERMLFFVVVVAHWVGCINKILASSMMEGGGGESWYFRHVSTVDPRYYSNA